MNFVIMNGAWWTIPFEPMNLNQCVNSHEGFIPDMSTGERLPFSFHDAPLTVMGHYLLLMSRAAGTEVRPSTREGATTPGDTIAPTRDYVRSAPLTRPKGAHV